MIALSGATRSYLDGAARREIVEIERRRAVYLHGRPRVPLEGRSLILVDDGVATGASVRVALKALRRRRPRALVLAVPVAPTETIDELIGRLVRGSDPRREDVSLLRFASLASTRR